MPAYCRLWAGAVCSWYLLRSPPLRPPGPSSFFLSRIPLTGGSRGKCSFCCIEHAALWPRKILQNPSSWDTYQVKLANIPQAGVRRTSGGGWRGAHGEMHYEKENKRDHDSPRRSFWKMFSNLEPHSYHSSWLWVTAPKCFFFFKSAVTSLLENVQMNPAHAAATISSKRPIMVSRHPREVHLTDKFLYLLIQYKSPKVWKPSQQCYRGLPRAKKKAFYINSPAGKKSTNHRANTLSNSRIRGFIQPNSLQADCQQRGAVQVLMRCKMSQLVDVPRSSVTDEAVP